MGKYPYYDSKTPVENSSYTKIDNSFTILEDALSQWEKNQESKIYENFLTAINYVWKTFAIEYSSPNPYFEKQKKIYEKCGFEVIPVPILASGSGGLHCTILY